MPLCDYGCGKEAIKQITSSKKWCCSTSINSCEYRRKINSDSKKGKAPVFKNGHPRPMLGKAPYNKGKTYEELHGEEKAKLLKEKSRRYAIKHIAGKKHSEKTKQKLSKITFNRHANGWDNKAGRCKKYKYYSPIAGHVSLDGTWELKVAKWLDKQGYTWTRNTIFFQYKNLEGKLATYTPDFYVHEFNSYLEVKGYETELDRCKWSQFPGNLIIWKKAEIEAL